MGPVKFNNDVVALIVEPLGVVTKRLLVGLARVLSGGSIDIEPAVFIHWYSNRIHVPAIHSVDSGIVDRSIENPSILNTHEF